MKETRYFYVPDAATAGELPSDEATHAVRVLRLKEGDEVMLMDGQGSFYEAEITMASSHHCLYAIKQTLPQQRPWQGSLTHGESDRSHRRHRSEDGHGLAVPLGIG